MMQKDFELSFVADRDGMILVRDAESKKLNVFKLLGNNEQLGEYIQGLFLDWLADNDKAVCMECGAITPFTDDGGRCETYSGWLCHDCIARLQNAGDELHFEDDNDVE